MVRGCPCVGDRLQSCLLLPMLGPGQLQLALGSLHQWTFYLEALPLLWGFHYSSFSWCSNNNELRVMTPLGLFSPPPHFGHMSTLSSNVHSYRKHHYLTCQIWVTWRLSGIEAEQHWMRHYPSVFAERKWQWNSSNILSPNWKQLWNICAIRSVLGGTFLLGIVAAEKRFFWRKLVNLQNIKGLKTDKSRWYQDHWLHFLGWHWSSEVTYAQALWTLFTLSRSGTFCAFDHELKL